MQANKALMQSILSALAQGDGRPFVDAMADDFCWTFKSIGPWRGTYRGKRAVRDELLAPLLAQFAERYTNTASRFIAEGEHVVVECQGRVTTKAGQPYNNQYCYVCRLEGGQLKELTEYMDTALAEAVLTPPERTGT
ncbi:MAG: nuclear transport factor 2 family protein [Hydrogenophaga sp.]|uniref:nuclear transport factor 2 family protein n=1 Tax=Hydrogenophaga sp. TaxID=1904254 RepID=UPI001D499CBA|nr:nuclear transport factor 2 family protein [Hydrogenophaga sp.]MBX3608984.1 nuclear transport factor 2 family protein [Hydrogenophaga sp.]